MVAVESGLLRRNGQVDPQLFPPLHEAIQRVTMSDLIAENGELATRFQDLVRDRLAVLHRLPQDNVLQFNKPPKPHPGSKAQYFLEYTLGDWHIYLYVLPPNMTTSLHYHPEGVHEQYELLAGEFTLMVNDDEIVNPKYIEIGSFVDHQGMTGDKPALVMAMTHNPKKIPPGELHIASHRNWEQDWGRDREKILRDFKLLKAA